MATASELTPDGSPVPVYLALPLDASFDPLLEALSEPGRVLDLGCGVGRLAGELARRGHEVVGVDESPSMLAHLPAGVRPVHTRIEALDLEDRFDTVVMASHLVNVADLRERRDLLAAAARHLDVAGRLFAQHHRTDAFDAPAGAPRRLGDVEVDLEVVARDGDLVDAVAIYRLDGRAWRQPFRARLLDDAGLREAFAEVGLTLTGRLSPVWVEARHRHPAS